MNLNESLQSLSMAFAREIVSAVLAVPMNELAEGGPRMVKTPSAHARAGRPQKVGKAGRLKRRSIEEIEAVVVTIVGLLKKHKTGLRAEQIRAELGLEPREMPRVLKQGIMGKTIKVLSGQKRSTVYGVGGKAAASITKKAPRKAAKRVVRKTVK